MSNAPASDAAPRTFAMEGGWPTHKTYPRCFIVRVLKRYCIVQIGKFADGRPCQVKVRTVKDANYYAHEIRADSQNWRGDMFEKAKQLKVTDIAQFEAALQEAHDATR